MTNDQLKTLPISHWSLVISHCPTGIALGSNIGDRLGHLQMARDRLNARYGEVRCSRVYETEPVDCEPGTSAYLNAVVEIDFRGDPEALLKELQAIEIQSGRPSSHAYHAPRTLDLDLLYIGDLTHSSAAMELPHPRLHLRRFVLAPLCDIRPDLLLPGHTETVSELLLKLPQQPSVSVFSEII